MNGIASFYHSTIGKKIIMAVTGLIGIGFVIGHMAGNLQAFIGADKFNSYAAMLQGPLKELVWLMRILLVVAVILHVIMAVQLSVRSRAARPVAYRQRTPQVSTLASRTMLVGGILLLLFIPYHILHFTVGAFDPGGAFGLEDGRGRHDVYSNIVLSFRVWWVTLFYLVSMAFLGLHLFHGAWSSLRTLGYAKPGPTPLRRRIALGVAVVIWLGFSLVPLGVLAGIIR